MKPSEVIEAALPNLKKLVVAEFKQKSGLPENEWESLRKLAGAEGEYAINNGALLAGIINWLDYDFERRAKFEQDITERVWALEAAAGKFETDVLERLAKLEGKTLLAAMRCGRCGKPIENNQGYHVRPSTWPMHNQCPERE